MQILFFLILVYLSSCSSPTKHINTDVEIRPKQLIVHAWNGSRIVLVDRPCELSIPNCVQHTYHSFFKDIYQHLIREDFYEGGSYVLIDARSGIRTSIQSPPVISPDSKRFATSSFGYPADYEPTGIQIWNLLGLSPKLEYSIDLTTETWGPGVVTWQSPTSIKGTRLLKDRSTGGYRHDGKFELILNEGNWKLTEKR